MQSEPPVYTTITKKWTQVSYTHEKLPTLQQRSKTADRTLHQHIPETRNRFEILSNPSAGLDNYKIENKTVKQAGEQGGDLLPSDTNAEGNGSRTYKNEQDDSDTSNWRWRKWCYHDQGRKHRCWYQWARRHASCPGIRLFHSPVSVPAAPAAGSWASVILPHVQVPALFFLQKLCLHILSLLVCFLLWF